MNTNTKVKESKGYEYWATKHSLNTMAESVIFLREQGIKFIRQLDEYIQKAADGRQNLQDKSRLLIRKCRNFLPLWSKFIPSKNTGNTTRSIKQIHLIKHFSRSINFRLSSMKLLFQNLKNPIPNSQIQRIF